MRGDLSELTSEMTLNLVKETLGDPLTVQLLIPTYIRAILCQHHFKLSFTIASLCSQHLHIYYIPLNHQIHLLFPILCQPQSSSPCNILIPMMTHMSRMSHLMCIISKFPVLPNYHSMAISILSTCIHEWHQFTPPHHASLWAWFLGKLKTLTGIFC